RDVSAGGSNRAGAHTAVASPAGPSPARHAHPCLPRPQPAAGTQHPEPARLGTGGDLRNSAWAHLLISRARRATDRRLSADPATGGRDLRRTARLLTV